jgi:hypothetical protein
MAEPELTAGAAGEHAPETAEELEVGDALVLGGTVIKGVPLKLPDDKKVPTATPLKLPDDKKVPTSGSRD